MAGDCTRYIARGRQAGRQGKALSLTVLLLQLGRREIDDRPSQCHYTLPPSSTSSTSSGAPVCAPSAAPTPCILHTLINTRRVELSLCLPECMYARALLFTSHFLLHYVPCRAGTTICPRPTKGAHTLSILKRAGLGLNRFHNRDLLSRNFQLVSAASVALKRTSSDMRYKRALHQLLRSKFLQPPGVFDFRILFIRRSRKVRTRTPSNQRIYLLRRSVVG